MYFILGCMGIFRHNVLNELFSALNSSSEDIKAANGDKAKIASAMVDALFRLGIPESSDMISLK